MMQAARFFFFCHFLLSLAPWEARSAGCSRCRLGLHSPPGSRGTDTGEDMDWMDGRTGDGLGSVWLECWSMLEQPVVV